MNTLLHFVFLGCIGLVLLFFSVLWVVDMLDKVNTLKEYLPLRLVQFAGHKTWHGIFLLICWILLVTDGAELYFKEVPEVPHVPPIRPVVQIQNAPTTVVLPTVREPKDSLRRRILRVCDELEAFGNKRSTLRMQVPDVRDASGKATEMIKFDTETVSLYVDTGLKNRTLEVIREIKQKGLNTGSWSNGRNKLRSIREDFRAMTRRCHFVNLPSISTPAGMSYGSTTRNSGTRGETGRFLTLPRRLAVYKGTPRRSTQPFAGVASLF